jgi:D-alanine-D-alanine ligase
MRIAVLHNAVPDDAPLEDRDTLVQVDVVSRALAQLGHEPARVSCTLDLAAMCDQLRRMRPQRVFNLVESLADSDSLAYLPLAVLDSLGLLYTGSRTETLFLTTHKILAKQRMRQAGLPTPAWIESSSRHTPCADYEGPEEHSLSSEQSSWILKGIWDQGSRDMDDDAVLKDVGPAELDRRLRQRIARTGRPCFAEQFIDGREFAVALLAGPNGPEAQPPAEIEFTDFPPEKPRIVGYRAKWRDDCFEYHQTPCRFEFDAADKPLLDRLRSLAESCWTWFGLRGSARVDFRVDAAGQPWILEINANPCLSPDAGFAAVLAYAAIPFEEAIRRILEDVA